MLRILTQTFIKIRDEFFRKIIYFQFNFPNPFFTFQIFQGTKTRIRIRKISKNLGKMSENHPAFSLSLSLSFANYSAIEHGRLSSRAILSVVVGLKFAWCGVTSCHRWIFMGAVRGRSLYRPIRCARVRMELSRSCAKRK